MKNIVCILFFGIAVLQAASAPVPERISYQGRVLSHGRNFDGAGQFRFALIDAVSTQTLWSNDGAAPPAAAVSVTVTDGLFTVILGDTSLANMTAIPMSIFTNRDVRLRVWFNNGTDGFAQLNPDHLLSSVGYAGISGTVPDGAITVEKLATGVLSSGNFPANSINSLALADQIALGNASVNGRLDIFRTLAGTAALSLDGSSNSLQLINDGGNEVARLSGSSHGQLLLRDSIGQQTAALLDANGNNGGLLRLYSSNGISRAELSGANSGGLLSLFQADGSGAGAIVDGDYFGFGRLELRNTNSNPRAVLVGGPAAGTLSLMQPNGFLGAILHGKESPANGGMLSLRNATGGYAVSAYGGSSGVFELFNSSGTKVMDAYAHNGNEGVVRVSNNAGQEACYLSGRDSTGAGNGQIGLKQSDGTETLTLQASEGASGSQLLMRKANGIVSVQLDAEVGSAGGGYLDLRNGSGAVAIVLNADTGRMTTPILEITGGADLSEQFDINTPKPEPGMIVSIDPRNPGELVLCTEAYDQRVAGIISGAGGVKPGMLMGQRGSVADGRHPVALSGRVYGWMDADAGGAIQPGDLLTTSARPGHGMKVGHSTRAQGAIIGKAMTALDRGTGLVLVLVTLQ